MNEIEAFAIHTWDILGAAALAVLAMVPGMGDTGPKTYAGYVEADYVYVAAVSPGVIETLAVAAGDKVAAGDALFAQKADTFEAALAAAEASVSSAEANLRNLETGSREQEIDVIRASLKQARSELELARLNLQRSETLLKSGTVAPAQVDRDRANMASGEAKVAQLQAQLEVAELPARSAQLDAAKASARQARAQVVQAQAQLNDRRVTAPQSGIVEQVFFDEGEMANAGQPVVSLLPADAVKVRFYIPEPDRAAFGLGAVLAVDCDGCGEGVQVEVSFMARDPQTTPPIIYSREERARLVFMAEAEFIEPGGLLPGQPVSLSFPEEGR